MLLAGLLCGIVPAPAAASSSVWDARLALSEIQPDTGTPPPVEEGGIPLPGTEDGVIKAPLDPVPGTGPAEPEEPGEAGSDDAAPGDNAPPTAEGEPAPEVLYDLSALPEPVRRMRERIVEACLSGELEALRPLLGSGDSATQISLGGFDGDPVEHLRELSGDEGGQEILAILFEVFEAGYVHLDPGTPEEIYLWPYFFAVPLDSLDARQRVELFMLVTAGDYEDMKLLGAYNFYRAGITPQGEWVMFVAGS